MIRRGKGTTDTETMTLRRETCSQGAHSPTFHDNMATLFPKIDGISLELLVKAGDKPVVEINCGAILISHRGLYISSKARVSSFLIMISLSLAPFRQFLSAAVGNDGPGRLFTIAYRISWMKMGSPRHRKSRAGCKVRQT